MKKNILIFGYGDLAQRLSLIVDKNSYRVFGVSRTSKETLKKEKKISFAIIPKIT